MSVQYKYFHARFFILRVAINISKPDKLTAGRMQHTNLIYFSVLRALDFQFVFSLQLFVNGMVRNNVSKWRFDFER